MKGLLVTAETIIFK